MVTPAARWCWFLPMVLGSILPSVAWGDAASREIARAEACYQKQDYAGTLKHVDWVLEHHSDRAEAWMLRGYVRLSHQDFSAALADFSRADGLKPHNIDIIMGRVQARQGLQDWAGMLLDLNPLVEAGSRDGRLYVVRADALMNQNEWTQARADLDQAIRLGRKDALPFADRGLCLIALNQPARAIADLDLAIKLEKDRSDYRFIRVAALLMTHRYDEAVTDLDHLIKGPERAMILFFRGATKFCQHDYTAALSNWDAQIQLEPKNAQAWTNRALAHLALRQYEAAMTDADEAIRIDPQHPTAWSNRGSVLSCQKRFGQALADYNEAIRLAPRSAGLLVNRAGVLLHQRDYAGAMADYTRAAALDSSNCAADRGRALILAAAPDARLRNGLQALALANRATEQTNEVDPSSLHAQAAAHAELGNYARAVALAEEALRLPAVDQIQWQARFREHRSLQLMFSAQIHDEDTFRMELTRALAQYRAGQPFRML